MGFDEKYGIKIIPTKEASLGRRARQAGQRRTRRRPRAVRPDLRRAAGHRRAEEGHGRADDAEQQRPGHHAVQPAGGQGRDRRRRPGQADGQEGNANTPSPRPSRPAPTPCGCTTGWRRTASTRCKDVKIITVPPPQMVANMRVGNMDGFCVGEPWNNRAIIDSIGFTAVDHAGHLEGPSGKGARHHRRIRARSTRTPRAP